MTLVVAIFTVILCLGVFVLPRRVAPLLLLGTALYITQGQSINLGLNLTALRFVEIATFVRVVVRGELRAITFSRMDKWLLIFFSTVFAIIVFREGQIDSYALGEAVDGWLVYFSFRALIKGPSEYFSMMKGAAFVLLPFALLMSLEAMTGHNPFAFMGGVPNSPILREGHYRCQGSFRVPITAGSVGATFTSLFVGFLFFKKCRIWAILGIGASLGIVVASHSSGPLTAMLTGAMGWMCWSFRRKMAWVRRGIFAAFVVLQLAMTAPVWFIFDRLSGILGGDGWHRSNLIDKFVHDYREWSVDGMDFLKTADWAATQLPTGGVDVTNYYISIGISGGVISLLVFLIFLTVSFSEVGRAGKLLREWPEKQIALEAMAWGAGCTLCAHVVNLTAVSYWDQSYVIWYLHLAIVGSLSSNIIAQYSKTQMLIKEEMESHTTL